MDFSYESISKAAPEGVVQRRKNKEQRRSKQAAVATGAAGAVSNGSSAALAARYSGATRGRTALAVVPAAAVGGAVNGVIGHAGSRGFYRAKYGEGRKNASPRFGKDVAKSKKVSKSYEELA